MTDLPVIGVPVPLVHLEGLDSLLSIVQMPAGIPVGTLAIGEAGAANAGILAAQILALSDPALAARVADWRRRQTESVAVDPAFFDQVVLPTLGSGASLVYILPEREPVLAGGGPVTASLAAR